MLFHTWTFAIFLAVVYLVYIPLRKTRFWMHWLLVASYVFYGWKYPPYLLLVLYSTVLDYGLGIQIGRTRHKKLWLALSVINNLWLLAFFKYAGFITENLNRLFVHFDIGYSLPQPDVLLPVGISFFTFQSLSYTIDVYRGLVGVERRFIRFATFVSLFPQLVAGPIERAKHILPQITSTPPVRMQYIAEGLSLFFVGLFKKLALADFLSLYVDPVYNAPGNYPGSALIAATFAYAWQIYFDFSGYTDMARGVARMLGLELMLNFDNPYLADSLGDFWRRWHISLSSWFKDYLYIPLGGNRKGTFGTYRNMVMTMAISGLWHGASWTFLIWGLLHAAGRVATRELERSTFYRERIPRPFKQLAVFVFVCFTWVFFRAKTFDDALLIVRRILTDSVQHLATIARVLIESFGTPMSIADALRPIDPRFPIVALVLCLAVWAYQFAFESRLRRVLAWSPVKVGGMLGILLYLAFFTTSAIKPFIYFQF